MTREEAIDELSVIWERLSHPEECENGCYSFRDGDYLEALDMAIEALQTDLVRCKDCRHRKKVGTSYYCELDEFNVKDEDFCSWGERREE